MSPSPIRCATAENGNNNNFIGEWEEFMFNAFVNPEPVQRYGCDIRRLRSFEHSTRQLEAIYLRRKKIVVKRELQ